MFEKAKWIWNSQTKGTDCYAEFITECEFQKNDLVSLRISVDSNYALYLNGKFVESGQYADYPHYKVYDEIDLTDYIVNGKNYFAIIVWYYGVPSSTYYVGKPGLLFEVEQNGTVILWSDETILSRMSEQYISGRNEMITPQLGLNFHVDLRKESDWMLGKANEKFTSSIELAEMPRQLFPREIKKLFVKSRVPAELIRYGTFVYSTDEETNGAKMQHAALTFFSSEDRNKVHIKRGTEDGIYFLVDLKEELSGYLDFDLEVMEDCKMEIGWGEHLEDGRCRTEIGVRNFSVTIQLRKGQNCYMNPFRRFGCRYLQFFVHTSQLKINYAGLRPVIYPVAMKEYKSGDVLRDKIYAVSQHTLLQCMHEHYEDCPWREQAFYTLDSRNQMLCGYYAFHELEFPRASLRLISKSIRADGALPICFPDSIGLLIPSFTLFYIMQLAEYYKYSKDIETIKECFECARRIVDAFVAQIDETGLLPNFDENKGFWNFYEWQPGMEGYTYRGKAYDMCLNALFSFVLDYFIELSCVLRVETQIYRSIKKKLNCRIADAFYDTEQKMFRTCLNQDIPYSVLANALGYLCGATEYIDATRILEIVRDNGGTISKIEVIPATLSMYTFRYEVLLQENKEYYKNFILEEIDRTYLKMLRKGATSFWETCKGEKDFDNAGSLCHGWSAMPIYYFEVLCEND